MIHIRLQHSGICPEFAEKQNVTNSNDVLLSSIESADWPVLAIKILSSQQSFHVSGHQQHSAIGFLPPDPTDTTLVLDSIVQVIMQHSMFRKSS